MESRVLKNKKTKITQGCSSSHIAVDLVGEENGKGITDTITAHSSGKVIEVSTGHVNEKGSTGMRSYGNYVQILHDNGYTTFYLTKDKKIMVSCGCFNDTIEKFIEAVQTTHKDNKIYRDKYMDSIEYARKMLAINS